MNLFMHYAFDRWMKREHPRNPFPRYADDAVAHCRSERYEFRPRRVQRRDGKLWTNFLPAVSDAARKRMRQKIREWQIPRETSIRLHELSKRYNHHLRGWLNYFSHFRKSETRDVCGYFDQTL